MNLSNTLRMMGRNAALAPGSQGDETVLDILDSIDLEQYFQQDLPGPLKAARLKAPLNIVPRLLPVMQAYLRPEAFLRKYSNALPGHLQRFEDVVDPSLSIDQQASNLASLLTFFLMDYGLPMVFAPQIAQSRIRRLFEEDGDRVREQLLSLGSALPGNRTAEMGELMVELASSETIRGQPSADAFVAGLDRRTLDPAFLERWERFVDEFGFRCPREIDVATPRPGEQPSLLFEQLKCMSLALDAQKGGKSVFEEARAKREEAYRVLHELALQKGRLKARALARHFKVLITLGGHRETGKHYAIKVVDLFRKRVLEVAGTFLQAGRLDHAEQIFDLTVGDIDQALADATINLRVLAQERAAPINRIRKSHLVARVIDSRGKIYAPPRKEAAPGELAGVSISPGVVEGRVKVLHHADEKPLLPGEILVTRATDPGWTPLFIHAGGIVLEIGGALQHGAVVAREFGVPCVSGLTGATELLKDGQMVEVDGTNGIVRILEGDEALQPERHDPAQPRDGGQPKTAERAAH
jgi:pyruvate,water dikinase